MTIKKIAVAFSGGLDTTYCTAFLKETTGAEITTITVDTGGFDSSELAAIETRSRTAGADRHICIDGRQETFDRVVKTLIQGNVLRGNVYPLSVSAERIIQAELLVREAQKLGADAIAHGSTGAGNDQVRFDVAIRTLAPDMKILTPVRDLKIKRGEQTEWLRKKGIDIPEKTTRYSINAGLWGITIGGGETHDPWLEIPDSAYPNVVSPQTAPAEGVEIIVSFTNGVPSAIDGKNMPGPALVVRLSELGVKHGFGRGIHTGDTIMGIKGRIAFEAPAAMILIAAHRELEKLVLTKWQQFWKDKLADFYGMLLHEALFYDPVARDIEAMIVSSQSRVTGAVRIKLNRGVLKVTGVKSAYAMMDASKAVYGEGQTLWDARDAEGFTKIYGLQGRIAAVFEKQGKLCSE